MKIVHSEILIDKMIFLKSMLFISLVVGSSLGIQNLPDVDADRVFDQELYKSVLDPELCARQLQYVRNEDLALRLQFLDSGLRLPRNILKGNTIDFGNFHQCLSINQEVEDMIIQGKHCLIDFPLDFLPLQDNLDFLQSENDHMMLNETHIRLIEQVQNEIDLLLAKEGKGDLPSIPGMSLSLTVTVCIPQACTPVEALGSTFLNLTGNIENMVNQLSCRLPNDKPFVAADYVAWVVFSLLGLVTIFSTTYDVRHTIILKKGTIDPKEANELYSTFSLYKNSCKIINITTRPGTVECLDGIRALSVMWVIIGHTYMMALFFPANPLDVFEWYSSKNAIWMKSAPLAVDTFFLLSGLLVVYTTASKFTPMKLLKNLHLFYLNRYLRLIPVLAVVMLFVSSISIHIGDGAAWIVAAAEAESCRSYWWLPLLHLQNFLKPRGGCLAESWYLAIDMQLHLISPIVLFWIFSGSKKSAWVALISAFTVSLSASTIYIFVRDFSVLDRNTYFNINIITRAPPFFVGLIYGYVLHLYRDKKCGMSKTVGYSVTGFVLCITALVIYCFHIQLHGDISVSLEKVFMCFLRSTWVACVGWIIFACVNGYADPINWLLSMSVWKIPSKLSYSMYLSHMTIIMYSNHLSSIAPVYFTVRSYMFNFMGYLYLSIFVSFFLTALVELPFATLFRILLIGGNKNQKKPVQAKGDEVKVEA